MLKKVVKYEISNERIDYASALFTRPTLLIEKFKKYLVHDEREKIEDILNKLNEDKDGGNIKKQNFFHDFYQQEACSPLYYALSLERLHCADILIKHGDRSFNEKSAIPPCYTTIEYVNLYGTKDAKDYLEKKIKNPDEMIVKEACCLIC